MNSYYMIADLGITYSNSKHYMFFSVRDNGDIFGQVQWFIKDRQSDPKNVRLYRYQTKKQWDTAYNEWLKRLSK